MAPVQNTLFVVTYMDERGYPFEIGADRLAYKFESVSANKKIQKAVLFTPTENETIFNLALVDLNEDNQMRDDIESRNGDMSTVLATIFQIIEDFLNTSPELIVMLRSNDSRRQQLYRIALSRELPSISKKFEAFGGQNGKVVPLHQMLTTSNTTLSYTDMKETKTIREIKTFKLTPTQQMFVDQKLKEANEYLKTADLSLLFEKKSKPGQPSKS